VGTIERKLKLGIVENRSCAITILSGLMFGCYRLFITLQQAVTIKVAATEAAGRGFESCLGRHLTISSTFAKLNVVQSGGLPWLPNHLVRMLVRLITPLNHSQTMTPPLDVDFVAVCDAIQGAWAGSGETVTSVAARFGVSRGRIHKWVYPAVRL